MIEDRFDIPFVAKMALREKQIQQNYRPIIAVHKWFARRPGTLYRGLLLAEFGKEPLSRAFCKTNQFEGMRVADPFMGGGTPLIEANRLGCDITGFDINPMAYWVVRQELEHVDLDAYHAQARELVRGLQSEIGRWYETTCLKCGRNALVKYFLWVKQEQCTHCDRDFDLWPGFLLARNNRHVANVVVCRSCSQLNEVADTSQPGNCVECKASLTLEGIAKRRKATCLFCGGANDYPTGVSPPRHRMFALEYHCKACRPSHRGRFFKKPDDDDLVRVAEADARARKRQFEFVPDEHIPPGDETNRLLRWGYRNYREMFNPRQLAGLELSCRALTRVKDDRIRHALATNLSDLLRYQNMLCRYDTSALKSLDIFSVHGFPVSLIQCESNLLGIRGGTGGNVGSGGWTNIVAKYGKAKEYCDRPFETVHVEKKKKVVFTEGEWIGERRNGEIQRSVDIRCADAAFAQLEPNSLDAVFTDPPYFGNVQYAELMDFCYMWLKRLVASDTDAFHAASTRSEQELTGNVTDGRDLAHFTHGLSCVFRAMERALKPAAPLAFTYHHNSLSTYAPVGVAILDSGLACTATLPCPAEMGGSIHISGTSSSIVDTVFVCRKNVENPIHTDPLEHLAMAINADLASLAEANYRATDGDVNCLVYGHLTRLAIGTLHARWDDQLPVEKRLERFGSTLDSLVCMEQLSPHINRSPSMNSRRDQKLLFEII